MEHNIHNIEADEATADLEAKLLHHAIGSTLYDKHWVHDILGQLSQNCVSNTDFESLSEMAQEKDVALYLDKETDCKTVLLRQLLQNNNTFRHKELSLVILSNIIRHEEVFSQIRKEATFLDIPVACVLMSDLDTCTDFANLLVALFSYIQVYIESLNGEEEEEDSLKVVLANEATVQQICIIIASTSNGDLLSQSARCLLSLVEFAAEHSIGDIIIAYAAPSAVQCLHEGLKQCVTDGNDKTCFVIVETLGLLLGQTDSVEQMEPQDIQSLCDTLAEYMKTVIEDVQALATTARVCRRLWTNCCHMDTLEILGSVLLFNHDNDCMAIEAIKDIVQSFLQLHSQTLLSKPELLCSPNLGRIVQLFTSC